MPEVTQTPFNAHQFDSNPQPTPGPASPMPPKKEKKGSGKAKGILMTFLIVLLILGGPVGVYFWQQSQIDSLKADNKQLSSQVDSLKKQLADQTAATEEAKSATYYEISELGVKFVNSDELSSLYYVVGNNGNTAYFSLEELKATDCAADGAANQIALTRYKESELDAEPNAATIKESGKKIGDYYFMIDTGQASCTEVASEQALVDKLVTELKKILPANLEQIQ